MKIRVDCAGESIQLEAPAGARLLEYLQNAEIPVNAACGGKGTCHKCRIQVQSGFLGATTTDRKAFSEEELAQGWRLSCQATPRIHLEILLPTIESLRSKPRLVQNLETLAQLSSDEELLVICDLGSTGVVLSLASQNRNVPLVEAHLLNKQIPYGSDVMTRLHSAQKQGVAPLQKALHETIKTCLRALQEAAPPLFHQVRERVITCAGNSVMTSLLHHWSIESLAVSPFQPDQRESFRSPLDQEWTLETLPLLAGFVGGDTVAGILALETRGVEVPWMLMDIGTNTEIVIKNERGEYWFSSAPAGPAFEGGNIHRGMRAESGAIAHASWVDHSWKLETIGKDRARGICGSGLIDILAEAVRWGLIQPDGYVPDRKLKITDQIEILADDVREFQLAKAATRTAAELLMERAQTTPKKIYLAGTFAQHLNLSSAYQIGLLPPEVPCEAIGNASLEGTWIWASMTLTARKAFQDRLKTAGFPIELALQDDFQSRFVRQLDFPADKR